MGNSMMGSRRAPDANRRDGTCANPATLGVARLVAAASLACALTSATCNEALAGGNAPPSPSTSPSSPLPSTPTPPTPVERDFYYDDDVPTPWPILILPPLAAALVGALTGAGAAAYYARRGESQQRTRETLGALLTLDAELSYVVEELTRVRDERGPELQEMTREQIRELANTVGVIETYETAQAVVFANSEDRSLKSALSAFNLKFLDFRRGTRGVAQFLNDATQTRSAVEQRLVPLADKGD